MTTNEMTMSTESGSDLDSEDIPYETDESKFGKKGKPLKRVVVFMNCKLSFKTMILFSELSHSSQSYCR